jgi:hypothetical protein
VVLLFATVLLSLSGAALLLTAVLRPEVGPEAPARLPLVTGPLAVAQVAAVGLALAGGALDDADALRVWVVAALPGHAIATTVASVFATSASAWTRAMATAVLFAAVAGCSGVLASTIAGAAGTAGVALVLLVGAGGHAYLGAVVARAVVAFVQDAAAAATRDAAWYGEQAATLRREWDGLPTDATLVQLLPFVHAPDEAIRAQCHARIAAMPELDGQTSTLLRSGWAEHMLSFVAHDYPRSRTALAPALAEFLDAALPVWESRLRQAALPHVWSGNIAHLVAAIRATVADGGELRPQAARWAELLRSIRGMSHLAADLAA